MEKPRFFKKLEVTKDSAEKFERLHKHRGLTQIEAATRIFDWFMSQDSLVQQAIWRQLPETLTPEAVKQLKADMVKFVLESGTDKRAAALLVEAGKVLDDAVPDQPQEDDKGRKRRRVG